MPPKKRGGYSQAHAAGGDASDRMRSHSEASTPSKKWEGMLGEEVMLHVKKLRLLQKRGDDIPKDKAIEKTRKYLTVVGNAISHLCSRAAAGTLPASNKLSSDELHSKLWQFVARFTENNLDGENLARIYSRVSKGHAAARDSAALDRDTAAAGTSRGADLADDEDYVAPDSRRRSYSEAGTDDRRQQWEEEEDDYQQEPSPQEHYPSGRRDWDRERQRGWD